MAGHLHFAIGSEALNTTAAAADTDDGDAVEKVRWLTKLPKAELHLHLEGTISPATLVALSERHDETPVTLAEAEALYKYDDFQHFLQVWMFVCQRLQTPADYGMIARDMFASLAAQGVKHAEVFVAVGGIIAHRPHLILEEVFAALEEASNFADRELHVTSFWIIDASRGNGLEEVSKVFAIAAELRQRFPSVIGVGLGGDEVAAPCRLFRDLYSKAQQQGMRLTAHCGESTGNIQGPREIHDALEMGVERLGHAYCAQFDEELLDQLESRQTPLELNVTSNLRTGVCPALDQHPIRRYVEHGLVCTLNSDDPAMFGSNVLEEYVLVQKNFGFDRADMKKFAANAFNSSFLDATMKRAAVASVQKY